ncbi:MAG: hypothetical protein L0Y71_10130 [Gemmataceae bacterium]|nr:hypothetical protein [Gemmataceae bacterium]
MIAGQSPRLIWKVNPQGHKRTIEEALEIARGFGVHVPPDVFFFEDEDNELPDDGTARGPKVTKPAGSAVYWSDLLNSRTGKVPFRIRSEILNSDEAIVGVIAHEMYELEKLRGMLKKGTMTIEHYIDQTRPNNPGNLHDEAWDCSDRMVEAMRKAQP